MQEKILANAYHTTTVCVNGYEGSIPRGRLYHLSQSGAIPFQGVIPFLTRMEELLNRMNFPQPFTAERAFRKVEPEQAMPQQGEREPWGEIATFSLKVIFRQNSSWQGTITWLEQGREESFRSVLELCMLLNSALAGSGSARSENPA